MMVSGHSYVLPSTGPDMSERKSSAVVVCSERQSNLNSALVVTKSTPHAVFQSLPHHCGVDIRKHTAHAVLKNRGRRQRSQIDVHVSQDPIFTKAELQSECYNTYREKQRANTKKTQEEQVWTDELEGCFQLALRKIPNVGRKKTPCDPQQCGGSATKPRGRNEHISHFISRHTGVKRNRKQISSHIQVLKGFQKDNDRWMALVTKPETNHALGSHAQHIYHSFPPNRSQNQIPTSFPSTNSATPVHTGDYSWGVIPSPATPPTPDYCSLPSSISSGASCTSASSIHDPSTPPSHGLSPLAHENCYTSQSQPQQHSQTYHPPIDIERLEYQFLSPFPAPPPLQHQLSYSSWQPVASENASGIDLIQGQVAPSIEPPAANTVPQWSGDHIELPRFQNRSAGCDAGVEAVKNEQILGRRERLPRAVESGVDGEAYWNAAERRW